MTTFRMSYGRRFRTAPYETAEIMIEDEFDAGHYSYWKAHLELRGIIDKMVDEDREWYQQQAMSKPVRKS